MRSLSLRKTVATLFLATAVTLSCAAPSQASLCQPRHASEEPGRAEPGGGILSRLLQLFELIGGALDPNGAH
jgi:hypothetical protein